MKHLAQYPGKFRHLWWLVTLAVLAMTAYVVAGRQLMQVVPEWRQPLEQLVAQRTGLPLRIGSLSGRMEGLTPVFHLGQVVVPAVDGDASHDLVIDRVSVSVDLLMSLMHRSLWLNKLSLSGLQLDLEQGEDGHLRLRGFPRRDQPDSAQASLQAFLKLLYQQKQVILDRVSLTLALHDMPVLTSRNLRLEMQSSGEHHRLALRLETEEAPLSLDLRVRLDRNVYDLADLNGSVWLALYGQDIHHWLPASLAGRLHLQRLAGNLAFWLTLDHGQLDSATLRLRVDELALADGKARWEAHQLAGLVSARRQNGYQVQIQGLNFATSGGLWQSGVLSGNWEEKPEGTTHWSVLLTQLDVDEMVRQFNAWPFALPDQVQQWRRRLTELAPGARLDTLYLGGSGHDLLRMGGQFGDLHVGGGDRTGVAGLGGWFDGTPAQGVLVLDHSRMTLALPAFYDHGLTGTVGGAVNWWHDDAGQLRVESGLLRVATEDASAQVLAGLTFPPGQTPRLHLLADVASDHIERTGFYLPTRHMSEALAQWLTDAIRGGHLQQGRFLYEGPVRIDPARQQDRVFQMLYKVDAAELHFLPDWPPLENLSGQVLVDGHQVEGTNLSGTLYRSHFERTRFEVVSNPPKAPLTLRVGGRINAEAGDVGRLLHGTPLAAHLPAELADWQMLQGQAEGSLALEIPLEHESKRTPQVVAEARLAGIEVLNKVRNLVFEEVAGQLRFDLAKGIQVSDLQAKWLGNPLGGSIATRNGRLDVDVSGPLKLAMVADWLKADWLGMAEGEAHTRTRLGLPWKTSTPVVLKVDSDLKGVAIKLPAPLAKPAEASLPFSLTLSDGSQLLFETGKTEVAGFPGISGNLRLEQGKLQAGSLRVGRLKATAPKGSGLQVAGYLPALKVQPWIDWIRALPQQSGDGLPLAGITLGVGRLDLYGMTVPRASLGVRPASGGGTEVTLGGEVLAGTLTLPPAFAWRGDQPMRLAVDHLNWQPGSSKQGMGTLSPLDMPTVDANLASVRVNNVDYGSWQGQLRPLVDGVHVDALKGLWRHAAFAGTLDWTTAQQKQTSHFVGSLTTRDLGAMQQAWGLTPQILSDKAEATLDLAWPGSPLDMDYLALDGKADVKVGACRLPQMDSNNGVLKVLGALNVGSIGRRLRLDFTDLYKKGLSCDSLKAGLAFDGEKLAINGLHLKSPSADIQLTGTTDLRTQALDAEMTVILPLSSNLYAGCLAGPAACAGIFVFDKLLGKRLEKAAALHYRVTGNWSKPEVKEK